VIILPESQKAFDYGINVLKNHGKCVVVSFPDKGFHFSTGDIVFRDISIVGSLVGSNKILREMLEFAASMSPNIFWLSIADFSTLPQKMKLKPW
jgi:propanol-preferring alcohol dehydrogenase